MRIAIYMRLGNEPDTNAEERLKLMRIEEYAKRHRYTAVKRIREISDRNMGKNA